MRRMLPAFLLVLTLVGILGAGPNAAQAADYEWFHWRTGLALPVALRFSPDGRLFYIEVWSGRIKVFADTTALTPTTWATVPIFAQNERGLMGLALHPAFPDSPYVYIYHTNPAPVVNRVARLTDQGGIGTNYCVIVDNLPSGTIRHNGGRIAFGPDGMLYATLGDNEVMAAAPVATDIRGKILRYTSMGVPAPGNPFGAGNPAYAKGVRNPFGLCFDSATGYGFFTDNGPECDDEANYLVAGGDFGWGPGDLCGSQPVGTLGALASYTPTIAPTGVCVYRGSRYPELDGNVLFGAFNDDVLRRIVLDPSDPSIALSATGIANEPVYGQVMDVIVGPDEEIWACSSGSIMRLYSTSLVGVPDPPGTRGFTITPNPFSTALTMRLPSGTVLERLDIMDLSGRRIRGWNGPLNGSLVWDGRDEQGRATPSGIYLVRGTAAGRAFGSRAVRLSP